MVQMRGSRTEVGTEGNSYVKGKVSVGEVHEPKVRVARENEPKKDFPQ